MAFVIKMQLEQLLNSLQILEWHFFLYKISILNAILNSILSLKCLLCHKPHGLFVI